MPSLSSFRKQFLRCNLKTPTLLLSLDKAILEGVGEMAPMDIQLRKCLLSRGSEHLFAEVLEFAALSIVSKCGPNIPFLSQAANCLCQRRAAAAGTKWVGGPGQENAPWGGGGGLEEAQRQARRRSSDIMLEMTTSHLLLKAGMLFFSKALSHDSLEVLESSFCLGFLDRHVRQLHNAALF